MQLKRSQPPTIAGLILCAMAVSAAAGLAATSNLPLYPGAKKDTTPAMKNSFCGHAFTITAMYRSPDNGKAVAKWYESKIPGATPVDMSSSDDTTDNVELSIYTPDGSQAVIIHQMTMKGATMKAAAKTLDMEKTNIALEVFDPPVGRDLLPLMVAVTHGDAAAKHTLEAKCRQN